MCNGSGRGKGQECSGNAARHRSNQGHARARQGARVPMRERSRFMRNFSAIACLAAVLWGMAESQAEQYPIKAVRLIMPYPAGGSTDIVGRLMAERLTGVLGQVVLVDNKPGASAQIGTEMAAK